MKNDINLIDVRQRPKPLKKDLLLLISIGLFTVVFIFSVFIMLYSLIEKSQLSALNVEVNNLSSRMNSMAEKKDKIATTTNRLATIKSILTTRKAIDSKVDEIVSVIPASFTINDFQAGDAKVSLAVSSASLLDFDNLLEVQVPQITKNQALGITSVDIGSFIQDSSGYSLNLTFYFTPKP